jgi:hypothetical protein
MRSKTCKSCKQPFAPARPLQSVCSPLCAIKQVQLTKIKTVRKEVREAKLKLKTRSDWLKEAQAVFNKFIRLRDAGLNCISCNTPMHKKVNAGHYKSVGAHPELRFNEFNVHAQCEHCNSFLSGNIVNYRRNLIKKIGIEGVEFVEGNHPALKLNIEEIKQLIAKYKTINKALETE